MTISAKVIAHSRPSWATEGSNDLFSLELTYPRFIHAEFMTHRVFSRNASSSRAIPTAKLTQSVVDDPAIPVEWGLNQPGMQAIFRLGDEEAREVEEEWLQGMRDAVSLSHWLHSRRVHKQIANRPIEPWSHITVVVTATEWDNFFALRDHAAAQPEIRVLAGAMRAVMAASTPTVLKPGEWHTPYALQSDYDDDITAAYRGITSVAGCARVSYKNHDSTARTLEKDQALHDELLVAGHMSPFEHQATPMSYLDLPNADPYNGDHPPWAAGWTHVDRNGQYWSGNLRGWVQYRQVVQCQSSGQI